MGNFLNEKDTSLHISNSRLEVDIAKLGAIYKGTRFDRGGFITQVTLDKKHTFCVPEARKTGEGTGGIGICNEFGILNTPGYDEAILGEKFLKIGVGLLTKPNTEKYQFYRLYETSTFNTEISIEKDSARFATYPVECNGYAVKYEKYIYLKENRLIIKYTLGNVGSKPIITNEYSHNFIGIDNKLVGPEYVLRFPYNIKVKVEENTELINITENSISWKYTPESAFYYLVEGFGDTSGHYWELVNLSSGTAIREYANFPIAKIAIWGTTHVISPEMFVNINIAPGESQIWSREFEFLEL